MKPTMPRTPFSTHLSGSARETEQRLRSIFSGPKKRPPLLFLALVFSAALLCGNLVSCQREEVPDGSQSAVTRPADPATDLADDQAYWMLYWEKAVQVLFERSPSYAPETGHGQIYLSETGADRNLLLAGYTPGVHAGGLWNLLLGTFDQEGQLADFYEISGDAGLYASWQEGAWLHILCANTTTYTGEESGGAPQHFRFDGRTLEAVALPQALAEQDTGDGNCKYLPLPGAVEVYRRTPGWMSILPEYQDVPQWEYQGTVSLTGAQVDPVPPEVREAAREYIAGADWEGVSTAGTPVLRLGQMAEWTDFSQLSLCREWQGAEDLELVAWDLDFGDPADAWYMNGQTHLLFRREGDRLTFLTNFYDYDLSSAAPEPELLAGLSPYNWYAVEALYDAGYLTARPRLADIFTQVPAPRQVWTLVQDRLEWDGLDVQIDSLEPRLFCVEEPHWMGTYAVKTSQNGVEQPVRLAFLRMSSYRDFSLCVYLLPEDEVDDVEQQARAAAHGLLDYEVALWDRSTPEFPTAYGPGCYDGVFTPQGTQQLDDGYVETGDRYEARFRYGGWNGQFCVSLDTTRRLPTTRGVRVGDSLAKVQAAYPGLTAHPVSDALVYTGGQGTAMEFYFENGLLSRIVLKLAEG